MQIKPATRLRGELSVPGDKSISHRSVMLGAIADGTTQISGFLNGADCLSTISCFEKMGIEININGDSVAVIGRGLHGLRKPDSVLFTGNSGTTTRLLAGLMSAQAFSCTIDGDASIRRRPMKRVRIPLTQMGAQISSDFCPLEIHGASLHGISYTLPVASAQLKSSILLAGLYADGNTTIIEPQQSRRPYRALASPLWAPRYSRKKTASSTPARKSVRTGNTRPGRYFVRRFLPRCCRNRPRRTGHHSGRGHQ